MRRSMVCCRTLSRNLVNCFTVATGLCLIGAITSAAEAPTLSDGSRESKDTEPSATEVVRELLEIQQRLGGSIVADSDTLTPHPSLPVDEQTDLVDSKGSELESVLRFDPPQLLPQHTSSPSVQVQSLRDAAWQLDQSAERLERTELYERADALRSLARQLRLDARDLGSRKSGTVPTQSR